mgnify:CR=1 FL=1|tara:strand:+ start:142158 stop:143792 length:1635 start_codon:yes stop_codon:yes gene_type:complete
MECIESNLIDIPGRTIRPVRCTFADGKITSIESLANDSNCRTYLIPGFVDAHVHVESSMLTPSQFARIAVVHGTVATVSDPHEIANVVGVEGVDFMLRDASRVPFKFCFGAPSCVPATTFETAGAAINADQIRDMLRRDDIGYLAEMMNYPGVLNGAADVASKIAAAKSSGKPIDGHAPGLRNDDAYRYFAAGISTDHECSTLEEAVDKLRSNVFIQIREGSAARNFDALQPLIDRFPGRVMFCSDDKHPDELLGGHINQLCKRAIAAGSDLFHVLAAACATPVQHYGLSVGQMQVGDPADMVEINSIREFDVLRTFIDGHCVAKQGQSLINASPAQPINRFNCSPKQPQQFEIRNEGNGPIRVMVAHDRLLTTTQVVETPTVADEFVVADPDRDLLKLSVVNRYADAEPAVGFVRGFGLRGGALAGSVAHDSHNIIAVGDSDEAICAAVNAVIEHRGGLSVATDHQLNVLPLPVAGLMSVNSCEEVASLYSDLDKTAKRLGCPLEAPFMTLSFLALLVIPSLKLSDQGLFDGEQFKQVDLFVR